MAAAGAQDIGDDMRPHPMNRPLQGAVGAGKMTLPPSPPCSRWRTASRWRSWAHGDPRRTALTRSRPWPARDFASFSSRNRGVGTPEPGRPSSPASFILSWAHTRSCNVVVCARSRHHRRTAPPGVLQRAELREKGLLPDMLVMTATPIPRSRHDARRSRRQPSTSCRQAAQSGRCAA